MRILGGSVTPSLIKSLFQVWISLAPQYDEKQMKSDG